MSQLLYAIYRIVLHFARPAPSIGVQEHKERLGSILRYCTGRYRTCQQNLKKGDEYHRLGGELRSRRE